MNHLLAGLLLAVAMGPAGAQSTAKPPAKAAAKPATKPVAKPAPGRNPNLAPSAQKAVEEITPLEEPDPSIHLSEADLAVARQVYVGDIPCELGTKVTLRPLRREGFFLVTVGRNRFRMHPVESRTGAIRLEDPVRGAMWLQLGNKSMLMSQKLGQRLADECQSPDQATLAEAMKKSAPTGLLSPQQPGTATPTETYGAAPRVTASPPPEQASSAEAAVPPAVTTPVAAGAVVQPGTVPAAAEAAALPAPAASAPR